MSSPSSRWFHQGTDPGTIITLDQPVPSQWKILEKLNKRNFQAKLIAYQKFTQQDFSNVPKLLGYKVSTQDKLGLVPDGVATRLAWEVVPGLRLGDKLGNDPYWTLSAVEREHVRMAFMRALPQALEKGYGPYTPSLSKLVWLSQTGTLYFIGYFYGINDEYEDRSNIKIGLEALARYGLAKPSSNEWRNKNWNGDTTGWKM
ncbi:Uncharacterized protein PECH_006783 [Penicillium ucsense]|uniref:Uncharacterized protein n=1 Tax=Penicillium ucsense TaxID=2839758 RepID=A0A8J8VWK6_9EURO|nr:Uncharacterized protein PECM_002258 [Penicillium ucsense]KAF7735368.1 Uncharacterized protein PECH_006783 [Penicillium ucsense]